MANRQWALSPLPWMAWDAGPDETLLRVVYRHAAPRAEPLAEVELLELLGAVIVTLYERNAGGGKLAASTSCVEVELRAPLGRRTVHDGIRGEARERVRGDEHAAYDDIDLAQAAGDPRRWSRPRRFESDQGAREPDVRRVDPW
jgi:hypothetical protein